MFHLFGVDTKFLSTAVERIMQNVDKTTDAQISPEEFYRLLSQKFEKGDPRNDIETVFHRFDKKHDKELDAEELLEIGSMLGENLTLAEVHDMIKNLKAMHQEAQNTQQQEEGEMKPTKSAKIRQSAALKKDDLTITMDEFYSLMQEDL